MISKCQHLFHKKCLQDYNEFFIKSKTHLRYPICRDFYTQIDCTIGLSLNAAERYVKFMGGRENDDNYVENNEIVRKFPRTHEKLLQRVLSVRQIYLCLNLEEHANKLSADAKNVSIYDINMTHIETVIQEMEKEIMLNHTFTRLATTVVEVGNIRYDDSSDSISDRNDDEDSRD